jgi:hypothetical protein
MCILRSLEPAGTHLPHTHRQQPRKLWEQTHWMGVVDGSVHVSSVEENSFEFYIA